MHGWHEIANHEASRLPKRCDDRERSHGQGVYNTLKALSRAQSLASPSEQAQLYRDVAEARLRVQKTLDACGAETPESKFARDLILARTFLDKYDDLVAED